MSSVLFAKLEEVITIHENQSRVQIHNVSDHFSMQVYINGLEFGPLAPGQTRAFRVSPGLHNLEVRDERGRSITRQVDVRSGDNVIDWEVGYAATQGWLQIENISDHHPLRVFVDGLELGRVAPLQARTFRLEIGEHSVVVRDDTGRDAMRRIDLNPDETVDWHVGQPDDWEVETSTEGWLEVVNGSDHHTVHVFVDGTEMGMIGPRGSNRFPLVPGAHQVTVRDDRGRAVANQVQVTSRKTTVWQLPSPILWE